MARKTGNVAKYVPDDKSRRFVEMMTACGIPQKEICSVLSISLDTLQKHYREQLDTGVPKANAQVAQTLYKRALAGDVSCMIFWLKTRAGWRDVSRTEISGPDGGPVQQSVSVQFVSANKQEQKQ